MTTIGARIKAAREKAGITQQAVATALGISRNAVSQWESDSTVPERQRFFALAELLRVDAGWMQTGEGEPNFEERIVRVPAGQEFSRPEHPDLPATIGSETGRRGVPDDASVELDVTAGLGSGGFTIIHDGVARGDGVTFSAEAIRDHWRLPTWMLSRFNARAQHIVCFPVRGSSMQPTLIDGDVVFIDTRHRVPSPAGLYAMNDDFGGIVVKRLEVISNRGDERIMVRVKSDNPNHITRDVPADDLAIVGIVVGKFTLPEIG